MLTQQTAPPSFPNAGAQLDSMVYVGPNRFDYTISVGSNRFRLTFNPNQRSLQFSRVERTTSGDVLEKFEPHRGILLNFVEAFAADLINEEVGWLSNRTRPDPDDRTNPDMVEVCGYETPGACTNCLE